MFLSHPLRRKTFLNSAIIQALTTSRWKYLFHTLDKLNTTSFTKPHTIQLFNRYATYSGSSPYKAPAMLSLIPHIEFNEGVFYPKGGMINISRALHKLAIKKGVQFYFDMPVQRIIFHEGEVRGVVVNNENIYADVVVSNADVYTTYKHLLRKETKAASLLKSERSSGAIVFYWGINKEFPQLELHNIFFTKNYKAEFDHIFRRKILYNDPTVYVNITSKCEPQHAPAGKENWFVMINAPANFGQNWHILKQQCRTNIINKLNHILQTDIGPLIVEEETLDPISLESKTGSFMGAIYGTSSNTKRATFLRHPNFSKHTRRLYFTGGTVHPGGGIPLCLRSAKIVSELIQHDIKHSKH
jgi:phytoene desaturase